jgi:peptidoglycan/xylan/chitin deacetylase (PgdA/CDA1 family)
MNKNVGLYILKFISIYIISFQLTHAGQLKIALSFDDAPMPDSALMSGRDRTNKIIAALTTNKVSDALFFVKANNISSANEERLKQYTAAGYHLANHSFSHQSANEITVDEFLIDVYRAHLILKKFDNVLPYFRFPFLHYGADQESVQALQSGLTEMGYKDGFVTIDNFDWYMNSLLNQAKTEGKSIDYKKAEKVYVNTIYDAIIFYDDLARKAKLDSPKHVLLLHENDTTALFLGALIRHIKKNGGDIISSQEAYSDLAYEVFPKTAFHKQGRVAAIAEKSGIPLNQLRSEAEDPKFLEKLFETEGVIE